LTESDIAEFVGATTTSQRTIIEDAPAAGAGERRFYTLEQLIEGLKESKSANKWTS